MKPQLFFGLRQRSMIKLISMTGISMVSAMLAIASTLAPGGGLEGSVSLQSVVQDAVQQTLLWIQHDLGAIGPLVLILIYIVATVACISGGLLTLGSGAIFGLVAGAIYAFIGASLGAIAAFGVGRYLVRGWVTRKIAVNPKFQAIDRSVGREGFKIVFLTRLSPLFPFVFLNYAFGVTRVSLKDYVLGFVGMIPGTFLYAYLGAAAGNVASLVVSINDRPKTPAETILFGIGLISTIAVAWVMTRIARQTLDQQVAQHLDMPQNSHPSNDMAPQTLGMIEPMDDYNQILVNHVHPPNWVNPQPSDRYDLVVIGAGTAGLVVAAGAAGLKVGLKVALIERHLMGGDCLNVGCVPSKCMIRSSRVVADIQTAPELGIRISEAIQVDFAAVMERMRRIRSGISHHDSAQRFQELGVDVFLGQGCFIGNHQIAVGDRRLTYKKAVIATGARALCPKVEGLEDAGYLTNETVFSLTTCPPRLAVIGGGPIGCELAQTFRRLGSEVTLFEKSSHLLSREDADAAEIIQQQFIQEGIHLVLNSQLHRVEKTDAGKVLHVSVEGHHTWVTVDEILVGVGRAPNVEGLNLDAVGVDYDPHRGVKVNDYLQTTHPQIYAAGDVCMDWKFTHAADAAARIVIKNTLFSPFGLGRSKLSDLVIPWTTYTDPEIAHVGWYERDAQAQGIAMDTIKIPLSQVDRAIADGETAGFVKIHYQHGSDRILGATLVARHAGEMISEITMAIVHKIGLSQLSTVIHPYPTQSEGVKKAADAYRRTLLTPRTQRFLSWLTKLS